MDMTTRHEEIKDYLTNQMSPQQRQALDQEMAQNPDLQAEVEFMRNAFATLELAVQDDLRDKMKQWTQKTPQISTSRIKPIWRWSAAAAILLLIMAGAYFLWPADRYTHSKELYVYVAPGNLRGNAELTSEQAEIKMNLLFEESKNLFTQRKFTSSLVKLDEVADLLRSYELKDKQAKSDMLDWFRLLNWYNLNPKSTEYQQLEKAIRSNSSHAYHQKMKQL